MNAMLSRARPWGAIALALTATLGGATQGCLSKYSIREDLDGAAPDAAPPDVAVLDESAPDALVGPEGGPPDVVIPPDEPMQRPDVPMPPDTSTVPTMPPMRSCVPSSTTACFDYENGQVPMGARFETSMPLTVTSDRGSQWLTSSTTGMLGPGVTSSSYLRIGVPGFMATMPQLRYAMRVRFDRPPMLDPLDTMTSESQGLLCFGALGLGMQASNAHFFALCLRNGSLRFFELSEAGVPMPLGTPVTLGPAPDEVHDIEITYTPTTINANVITYGTRPRMVTVSAMPSYRTLFLNPMADRTWTIGTIAFGPGPETRTLFDLSQMRAGF